MPTKDLRRISVFYKSSGSCIYDGLDFDRDTATSKSRAILDGISAPVLWPLIKVFVQFSREVHGGSVKRLVFRSPREYAPRSEQFEATQSPATTLLPTPIVVHVAHDESFVVSVTEVIVDSGVAERMGADREGSVRVLTVAEFCESLIHFLGQERAEFLASLKAKSLPEDATARANGGESGRNSKRSSEPIAAGSQSHSERGPISAGSVEDEELTSAPISTARDSNIPIDETKLTEYITKTQTLLHL